MTLRKSLLAFVLCLFAFNAFSATASVETPSAITPEQAQKMEAFLTTLSAKDVNNFTIRDAEKLAGRKLTFKEKIGFKVAKMKMKRKGINSLFSGDGKSAPGIEKGIYILIAIVGFPFLSVGLASDWEGSDWLYCLLWTCLCWLPGFIYALMKMKKYYA